MTWLVWFNLLLARKLQNVLLFCPLCPQVIGGIWSLIKGLFPDFSLFPGAHCFFLKMLSQAELNTAPFQLLALQKLMSQRFLGFIGSSGSLHLSFSLPKLWFLPLGSKFILYDRRHVFYRGHNKKVSADLILVLSLQLDWIWISGSNDLSYSLLFLPPVLTFLLL